MGGAALSDPERRRAYVAGAQRDLNRHLRRLGAPTRLAIDGDWAEHTQRAFEQVCRVLGLAPERTVRTLRLIAGAAESLTEAERARAGSDGAAFERQLRRRFAQQAGAAPRVVLGAGSLPRDERRRAYVAALQRDLNRHLIGLGSPALLAVDGRWGEHTGRTFRRVCRVLGIEPERDVRTFRAIAGALAPRTAEELERAGADGADFARRLGAHFEHQRAALPRPPLESTGPTGDRVAAAIHAHGGRYGEFIVAESRRSGVAVSLICAVLEQETGFRNVFGHDVVRNPVKSPPGGLLALTEDRYRRYLAFRRAGLGNQGVGPMQLTSPGLQDRADQLGGCWRPGPNLRVGVEFLAGNIRRCGGVRGGLVAYNGSPAYADPVLQLERRWRARLGGAAGAVAHEPRTLRLTRPPMTGDDVAAFQRLLCRGFEHWRIDRAIAVDGEFGPHTRRAARQVAFGFGLAEAEYEHGFTPALRALLRAPRRRTAAQLERARGRAGWRGQLRAKHAVSATSATALLNGHKPPRPAGLLRIVVRGHERGLIVTSTNDGTHAATSYHYQDRAVDFGVPAGLVGTAAGRDRLVRFQRELASRPAPLTELFGPDNAACVKNGSVIALAEGTGLENQHDNHVHVAI